jgi:hypothetical protein
VPLPVPDPLTPTAGARFVLERVESSTDAARYHGRILTPEATFDYDVAVTAGAEPALTARAAAPAELEKTLAMIARLTARGAGKRAEDGLPPWPQRVTRWRGPGRGH